MPKQGLDSDERNPTSDERYKLLFETSSDAAMLLDEKGFFDCNPATLKMFGYSSKEEFCTKGPADLSPPTQPDGSDSLTSANKKVADAYEKGSNFFEWVHKRSNGENFPANVLLTAFELNGKKVIQATVRDITDLKKSQEKTRQLALIVSISQDAILTKDLSGTILTWNKGAEEMYGYSANEIVGENIETLMPDNIKGEEKAIIEKILKGEVVRRYETQRIRKDGTILDIELSVSPIKDDFGKITSMSAIARDITEQKRIRDNTERMNKLMVNRELRMIELKNQIIELKKQIHGN